MKPVLLVVAPYYHDISEMLIHGATDAVYAAGQTAEMISVPGALEIPGAIAMAAKSERYAAFVALEWKIRWLCCAWLCDSRRNLALRYGSE